MTNFTVYSFENRIPLRQAHHLYLQVLLVLQEYIIQFHTLSTSRSFVFTRSTLKTIDQIKLWYEVLQRQNLQLSILTLIKIRTKDICEFQILTQGIRVVNQPNKKIMNIYYESVNLSKPQRVKVLLLFLLKAKIFVFLR